MRRGKSFFKDPPFNSQSQLCYYFSICWKCLRWDQGSAAVHRDSWPRRDGSQWDRRRVRREGRGVERVAQGYLAAWLQSQEFSPISHSADVLRVSVSHARRSAVSRGCAVCGADVTGTDMSAPSSRGPLGDGALEVVLCSHANSKVREEYNLLKNLSERLFAEVAATRKEMLVQGLFVAFSGKYLDNSFMAMSNSVSPLCSLSQVYAFWMGMSHFR